MPNKPAPVVADLKDYSEKMDAQTCANEWDYKWIGGAEWMLNYLVMTHLCGARPSRSHLSKKNNKNTKLPILERATPYINAVGNNGDLIIILFFI